MIQQQALDLAEKLVAQYQDADLETNNKLHIAQLKGFTASQGWYSNFVRRFNLKSGKLSGICFSFVYVCH
jgi:Tc5 transposase DNA-binding domain